MPVADDDVALVAPLGVVPVEVGDAAAPHGCPGLRELAGLTLLQRAVATLATSAAVRRVVVAAPPELEVLVRAALAGLTSTPLDALDVVRSPGSGQGAGRGPDLARAIESGGEIVVVHDPLYPLAPAGLVRAVVRELTRAPDAVAAVPVRPVTDTLKWVDHGEVVRDTADRERYRWIASPQAYRRVTLLAALADAGDAGPAGAARPGAPARRAADVLPHLVAARRGRLVLVPAPADVVRVGTEDELVLAEALLRLTAGGPDAPSAGVRRRPGRAER
ncbi:MAG: 2-C-methyl-D-erythritol 4-phosphate cytidylyltransferase [Kineosporiaceae bacterium]